MTHDPKTTESPSWLLEQMRLAAAEVESWPAWKRDLMRQEVATGPRRHPR